MSKNSRLEFTLCLPSMRWRLPSISMQSVVLKQATMSNSLLTLAFERELSRADISSIREYPILMTPIMLCDRAA
eukprot:1861980-Rhodomonas_salina.1